MEQFSGSQAGKNRRCWVSEEGYGTELIFGIIKRYQESKKQARLLNFYFTHQQVSNL
jgi:hypothetical protein